MADPTQYEDEHRLNAVFALALERAVGTFGPAALKWALTAHFYAAVHWVNRGLARKHKTPRTHQERKQMMRQHWPKEALAREAYADLEGLSRRARYELWCPTVADLRAAEQNLKDVTHGIQ